MINKLASSFEYSTYDLHQLHRCFLNDWSLIKDFQVKRLEFLLSNSPLSCESENMNSSGVRDGKKRKYRWGPCFHEMMNFLEDIRYDNPKHRQIILMSASKSFKENCNFPILQKRVGKIKYEYYSVYTKRKNNWLKNMVEMCDKKFFRKNHCFLIDPMIIQFMIEDGISTDPLANSTVVSTGRILTKEWQNYMANGGVNIRNNMRVWDGGNTFTTCHYGNLHFIDWLFYEKQRSQITDLFNLAQPHIDYDDKDRFSKKMVGICQCGLPSYEVEFEPRNNGLFTFNGVRYNYKHIESVFNMNIAGKGEIVSLNLVIKDDGVYWVAEFSKLENETLEKLEETIGKIFPVFKRGDISMLEDFTIRYKYDSILDLRK